MQNRQKRPGIPGEIDRIGPDSLKVTIRQTDRGETIEDAELNDESFGGFGDKGLDGPYTAKFRVNRKPKPGLGHNRPPGGAGPDGWAGIPPSGPRPFILAIRQAEQKLPRVNPERDRAEWLERFERRLEQIERQPTKLDLFRERKYSRLREHTERRIQALYTRRYKPSTALEAQRFPKLPSVATKLLPKEARKQPAAERRNELEVLVADYFARRGKITICPPETVTRRKTKKKMGRPRIGERPMSPAERKRRERERKKLEEIKLRPPPPTVGEMSGASTPSPG